ncbi:MAG: PIN domain-containing protein [Actinobacteria bacterium]|nr:PIN domain-containing protein [Actinomycetota bacterium]MCB9388329.1 PIN domain-containing protein [Acidimicrobiia bacterium]
MSRLLLDTTFLIDAERSDAELDLWIADDDDVAVAALTLAELRVGALLSDGAMRARRVEFFEAVKALLPSVSYNEDVADAYADLLAHVRRVGQPRGAHDLIIAATARASGRRLVTADLTAFVDLPGVEFQTHR